MNSHKGARIRPYTRNVIVGRLGRGQWVTEVAAAFGVSASGGHSRRGRFAAKGAAWLATRSSRPHQLRA